MESSALKDKERSTGQELSKILELQKEGCYVEVIHQLQVLLEKQPKFFQAWMELGQAHRHQKDWSSALEAFQSAERIKPEHVKSKLDIAIELRRLGQLGEAEKKLLDILETHPAQPSAIFQLGEVYRNQSKFGAAIAQYQKVLAHKPDHPRAAIQIAVTYREMGQWTEAEQQLTQILEHSPEHVQACIQYGILERWRDRREQALHWFRQAEENSSHAARKQQVGIHIAEELRELDRLEEACLLAEALVEQNPGDVHAQVVLANIYWRQQKLDESVALCRKVLTVQPEHYHAKIILTRNLCDLGKSDMALGVLNGSEKPAIDSIPTELRKIEILRQLHQFEEVERKLQRILSEFPLDSRVLLQLGYSARQLGQRQKALDWFRHAKVHAIHAAHALKAQLCVVEELRDLNYLNEAQAEIQRILAELPQHRRANMILASIFYARLELFAAADVYRMLLQLNPDDADAQFELARVLSETQQIPEAIVQLRGLLSGSMFSRFRILMRLGNLAQSQEDWVGAQQWYEQARQYFPFKSQVYGALAEVMYQQAEVESAIVLLEETEQHFPHDPQIPTKRASLQMRLGYPLESQRILKRAQQRFPHYWPIASQLCYLHLQLGEFEAVRSIVENSTFDHSQWRKRAALIRAEMELRQFRPQKAEMFLKEALAISPTTPHEHNRLAQAYLLQGKSTSAYEQVQLATEQLQLKVNPGQATIPLKDHVAVLINQMRMNPAMLEHLQVALQATGRETRLELASIVAQEPTYLGAGLCLMQALRQEEIFVERWQALPMSLVGLPQIPRRIVQFWDSPTPPVEIEEVMKSWLAMNLNYEYIQFSLQSAIAFLRKHYDADVLKAFQYCSHPATQSDLFRLAYLNKMGGFYADADDRCRASLDSLVVSNAELVVYQEEYASIGNNFLGCIPNQPIIQMALYQAVENLLSYTTEGPWFQTGPGLMTGCVASGLLPYLSHLDYRMWPRLVVMSQEELRRYVWPHLSLPYKKTEKSWAYQSYQGYRKRGSGCLPRS